MEEPNALSTSIENTAKEGPSSSPPIPSPLIRDATRIGLRKLDGIYLPRLTNQHQYKPFASYYSAEREGPQDELDSNTTGATHDNPETTAVVDALGNGTAALPSPPDTSASHKEGHTSVTPLPPKELLGLAASTPIIVDEKPESHSNEERDRIDSSGHGLARSPSSTVVVLESTTVVEGLPLTRVTSPTLESFVPNPAEVSARSQSVDIEPEILQTARSDREEPTSRQSIEPSPSSTKLSSEEAPDLRSDFYKYEPFCHQCRSRNIFAKMKCTKIDDDSVCPFSYCHRCIVLRYVLLI